QMRLGGAPTAKGNKPVAARLVIDGDVGFAVAVKVAPHRRSPAPAPVHTVGVAAAGAPDVPVAQNAIVDSQIGFAIAVKIQPAAFAQRVAHAHPVQPTGVLTGGATGVFDVGPLEEMHARADIEGTIFPVDLPGNLQQHV